MELEQDGLCLNKSASASNQDGLVWALGLRSGLSAEADMVHRVAQWSPSIPPNAPQCPKCPPNPVGDA